MVRHSNSCFLQCMHHIAGELLCINCQSLVKSNGYENLGRYGLYMYLQPLIPSLAAIGPFRGSACLHTSPQGLARYVFSKQTTSPPTRLRHTESNIVSLEMCSCQACMGCMHTEACTFGGVGDWVFQPTRMPWDLFRR